MRNLFQVVLAIVVMAWAVSMSYAAEHGGTTTPKEHGGIATKEHGGTAAKTPSADDIRAAMKQYVIDKSKATGTFDIYDPEAKTTRKLELIRVHERVGKTGNYYYSCADFKDTQTGQLFDLDLDVEDKNDRLSVVDVRIHKEDGKERYTYDENDNRIPVKAEGSHLQGQEHGGKAPAKEHGGTTTKEHGGK